MTEEILHLVRERAAALVTRDWAVLDAQLHRQFIYTNSQGKRLARAAYVDFLYGISSRHWSLAPERAAASQ